MTLNAGNQSLKNVISIEKDAAGNEVLNFVIHLKSVSDKDHILVGPIPVVTGGKTSILRKTGKMVFTSEGSLLSMSAKSEFLNSGILGTSWKAAESLACSKQ